MKLKATISLYAGGPGSGCNPEVGKCGRKPTIEEMANLKGSLLRKALYQYTGYDRGPSNFSSLNAFLSNIGSDQNSFLAQRMQQKMAEYFGRDPKDIYVADKDPSSIYYTRMQHPDNFEERQIAEKAFKHLVELKPMMEKQAKDSKIKIVYRGIQGKLAEGIKDQVKSGKKIVQIPVNPLSSWSAKFDKAKGFANVKKSGKILSTGVVIQRNLDPKDVWVSHHVMNQMGAASKEQEFLLGSKDKFISIPVKDISF